jgi:hypothetical protein
MYFLFCSEDAMGVYHLMGLGRSPGAVTSAISYIGDRYVRWDESDVEFFSSSGSSEMPFDSRRGDVQALIIFTTPEIRTGRENGFSEDYIINEAGQTNGVRKRGEAMAKVLQQFLPGELRRVAASRQQLPVYWCDIDRTNPYLTFERIAYVLRTLGLPNKTGKEVWINLTGGNNVVNLALQLAASLLGRAARLYYLLSAQTQCLRHTTPKAFLGSKEKDHFWVDIPIVYLQLDEMRRSILDILENANDSMNDTELLTQLKTHNTAWLSFSDMSLDTLRRDYLNGLAGQNLIVQISQSDKHKVGIGEQWQVLKVYYSIIADLRRPESDAEQTLSELTKRDWFRDGMYDLR